MTTLLWVSLAVFVAALLGGLAFAGLRALAAWRASKLFRRRAGEALTEVTRRLAELEKRLADAGEAAGRLDEARRRLQAALAVASLLLGATGDARTLLRGIRSVVPRK